MVSPNRTYLLLLCALLLAGQSAARGDDTKLYQPKNRDAWDFWFADTGEAYYAFYLQSPLGATQPSEKWGRSSVGLATSPDLVRWTEWGDVLKANPRGQWNDSHIATGSTWRCGDKWLMLFTAAGQGGGIGLAESGDLKAWRKIGPVTLQYRPFPVPDDPYWRSQGLKPGESVQYTVLADPYVLPFPVDGWHYMVANCAVAGRPENRRGCTGLMRSKDGRVWEDCGIVALAFDFDRPETPQLWRHGDRWHLYFGGAREKSDFCRVNLVYSARSMYGPFRATPRSEIKLPDGQGFYIAKVLTDRQGRDVLLACVGSARLSRPYPVVYHDDGSISLEPVR